MAEVAAALYGAETMIEGSAAAALAVSGSTVPLHAKFQKIKSPSEDLAVSGSTANIVKNKVYVIGGEKAHTRSEQGVHVVSFRPDFGSLTADTSKPIEVDQELRNPRFETSRRPLQAGIEHLERTSSVSQEQSHHSSFSRIHHGAVSIEDHIYVVSGLSSVGTATRTSNTASIVPLDTVVSYNSFTNAYYVIHADTEKCTEGIPEPRYAPSCTSSPYPPLMPVPEVEGLPFGSHGTIFLHGGYDLSGNPLQDTWTFDIRTRAWHKFPTIVEDAVLDPTTPGSIRYIDRRLWYINGPTVMYLKLAEHDVEHDDSLSRERSTLGTGRVGSGQWQVVYPHPKADPATSSKHTGPESAKKQAKENPISESTPTAMTSHVIPLRTGAGRTYLLAVGQSNPQVMHLFQIPSSPKTAASIKDAVRDKASSAIPNLSDRWKSGKHEWSRVEVVQSTMQEGEVERPSDGLTEFAAASWEEYHDKVVMWGGRTESTGVRNEGWVISFD